MAMRVCERFGKWPNEFDELSFDEQRHLLAYEEVRSKEDIPSDHA